MHKKFPLYENHTHSYFVEFSETVCDKGITFLRNRISDNIESNTKTLFNENETRLLRKIVYVV